MSPLSSNPYDSNEYLQIVLCDVKWNNNIPEPDYGTVLYTLPPNGPVTISKAADYSEEEIKGKEKKKNKGVSRIEMKGWKAGEVGFQLELHTDDADEADPKTALEKFEIFADLFMLVDDAGRNQVYGITYPSVNAAGIEMVFFDSYDLQEEKANDLLTVTVKMKEVTQPQSSRKGSGEGGADGGGGDPTDKDKMADDAGGSSGVGDELAGQFEQGQEAGRNFYRKSGLGDN